MKTSTSVTLLIIVAMLAFTLGYSAVPQCRPAASTILFKRMAQTQGSPQSQDLDPSILSFLQAQAVDPLPAVELTLPEVVDIMAEYELVHETKIMTHLGYYGLTDPQSRTIYLNNSSDTAINRDTVIHEWLHIIYGRRGVQTGGPYEPFITQRAHEIYLQLYGGTPAQDVK